MSETVRREDGFNVVIIECDGCGTTIQQTREGRGQWFQVEIRPLARDKWNRDEELYRFDFCSTDCFREVAGTINPTESLRDRDHDDRD